MRPACPRGCQHLSSASRPSVVLSVHLRASACRPRSSTPARAPPLSDRPKADGRRDARASLSERPFRAAGHSPFTAACTSSAVTRARSLAVPWVPRLPTPEARLRCSVGRLQLVGSLGFGSGHAVAAFAPPVPSCQKLLPRFPILTHLSLCEKDQKTGLPLSLLAPSRRHFDTTSFLLRLQDCNN